MLLALDVGNTNTVLGLYKLDGDRPELAAHWRVTTHRTRPPTSTASSSSTSSDARPRPRQVTPHHHLLGRPAGRVHPAPGLRNYFHLKPLFVEPGIKTGMPVLVDNPAELGADRLVNAIAAFERYGGPCIVVDFGTATTFDVISAKGEYLGGAIAPGLGISADALFSRAARLGRVDIKRPAKVIGTNTVTHLQSGLYYGYIGLVDGILERMIAEMAEDPRCRQPPQSHRHRRPRPPNRRRLPLHLRNRRHAHPRRPASSSSSATAPPNRRASRLRH
jgi:type III pantothenate kinase